MKTTSLFVEILVIGGGILSALSPVILLLLGATFEDIAAAAQVKDLIAISVVVIYPLGLLWSYVADACFSRANSTILKSFELSSEEYHRTLLALHQSSPGLVEGMTLVRTSYRIARATTMSLLVFVVAFLVANCVEPRRVPVLPLVGLCVGFMVGFYHCWHHLRTTYIRWVSLARLGQ
jgi:hypothetical protein